MNQRIEIEANDEDALGRLVCSYWEGDIKLVALSKNLSGSFKCVFEAPIKELVERSLKESSDRINRILLEENNQDYCNLHHIYYPKWVWFSGMRLEKRCPKCVEDIYGSTYDYIDKLNADKELNKSLAWEAMVQAYGEKEAFRLERLYGLPKIVWKEPKV